MYDLLSVDFLCSLMEFDFLGVAAVKMVTDAGIVFPQIFCNFRNQLNGICFAPTNVNIPANGVVILEVSMKEDTISKHVKGSLQKTVDILQKQCDSFKQQVKEVKEKICKRAEKIVDAAKRKGQRVLYKITQVTGMRKKLDAIKNRVDRAIDRVNNLEKAVEECRGQQEKSSPVETLLLDCAVAEPQTEYGAERFEQYQREHGAEQIDRAAGQTVVQEVGRSR